MGKFRDRMQNRGYQGLWKGEMGNYCLMYRVSIWDFEKVLEIYSGDGYTEQ